MTDELAEKLATVGLQDTTPVIQEPSNVETPVLATSYFMQTHSGVEEARRELYQKNIKTSYSNDVMIFTASHPTTSAIHYTYGQECNGLILEQNTWRPLVVPPRTLRSNIDTGISNKFIHQGLYDIYFADDGTCFNMYYYKNKWIISTARGHTMNDMKWNSDKTYVEIISECLEKLGLTWEDFTSKLDKLNCYSFGFRHPIMQKFREGKQTDIYKFWFIQTVCLDETNPHYLWASDSCPIAIVPVQESYPTTVSNLRDLYKQAACALQDFFENGTVCYGFILRSVNTEITGPHSDLYIESSLMKTIRRTWYANNVIDVCHKNNWDKTLVITLYAYLDTNNLVNFNKLFPQFESEMVVYRHYKKNVVNAMVQMTTGILPNPSNYSAEEVALATTLLQMFRDMIRYDTTNKSAAALEVVYHEFVVHPDSFDIIMSSAADYLGRLITAQSA